MYSTATGTVNSSMIKVYAKVTFGTYAGEFCLELSPSTALPPFSPAAAAAAEGDGGAGEGEASTPAADAAAAASPTATAVTAVSPQLVLALWLDTAMTAGLSKAATEAGAATTVATSPCWCCTSPSYTINLHSKLMTKLKRFLFLFTPALLVRLAPRRQTPSR